MPMARACSVGVNDPPRRIEDRQGHRRLVLVEQVRVSRLDLLPDPRHPPFHPTDPFLQVGQPGDQWPQEGLRVEAPTANFAWRPARCRAECGRYGPDC
jgi:hypothetical protein